MSDGQAEPRRAFVSHASEDKERFVIPFATALRASGVEAWVDRWEMLPGDSLVRKIFEDGLENSCAVIVVLSRVSIAKPWVAEELDAAVVKRINTGSKLIPVVLDDLDVKTEVPAAVRHLVLEYVDDEARPADVVDRVVRAIYNRPSAPPVGVPPRYAGESAVRIGNLHTIDSLVLREAGAEAIRDDGTRFETAAFVRSSVEALGVTPEEVVDSLDVLSGSRYIKMDRRINGTAPIFDLTSFGLRTYLRSYVKQWPQWEEALHARLAGWNSDHGTTRGLADAAGTPMIVALLILESLDRRAIRLSKAGGGQPAGPTFIVTSPAQLRRLGRH